MVGFFTFVQAFFPEFGSMSAAIGGFFEKKVET